MTAGRPARTAGVIRGREAPRGGIVPARVGPAVRFPAPTTPIAKVQP